jgi:DNA invertase Pin-like site-specific DNA recombinase
MKAIILARESDKNQDSNDAQLSRISEYVKNKNLEEWKVFKLKESSTKGFRKKFQEIIEVIKSSNETIAVIVDTVDRLQRSFKESVIFDELRRQGKVEIHFYRENLIIHKNSNSADILRWDMGVMFAKSYVLQLSDNLKRKHRKMREDGEITAGPPLGYKSIYNDNPLRRRRTDIIPNEKAPLIVKMFELYAQGNISIKSLCEKMYELGLRTDAGEKVNQGLIFHYLNLTFYYGVAYSRTQN